MKNLNLREVPKAITDVTTDPKRLREEAAIEDKGESNTKTTLTEQEPALTTEPKPFENEEEEIDSLPEGLERGTAASGASVQYTNREKAKTKRSILKATEKFDSGYVKLGADVPKYIADELSFMSKRADVSQKDYILKLILEDMYKRGVFVEPKAAE